MSLEFNIDTKKWGKRRIGYFGWGLFLWSFVFCLGALWFDQKLFVIVCLFVMFIAGQFVTIYKNWDEFHKEKPEVIV